MKKLLFSLVAAAACGAVTAAPVEFTGLTTFDPAKPDDGGTVSNDNRIYWEIDTSSDPELTVTDKDSAALDYLQINTGSTPLWRTFSGIADPALATDANLDAAGVAADGKVVSSDVKLTACTEFPKLTDFPNEKLALFLFTPEEGDDTPEGLYAIGGEMTDGGLKAKAYKLDIDVKGLNVTNAQGWAKVSIKTYGDIYKAVNETGVNETTYPAFVIGINGSVVGVAGDYVTGFENDANLIPAATARITGKTLIPAALTGDGTIAGLGFQGEGGIDNVDLAAKESEVSGMADAVAMTVDLTDATLTEITGAKVTSLSADGNLEFDPGTKTITFRVSAAEGMVVTVKLGNDELTATNGVYSFTPAANAALTVTAAPAAFQIGDAKYATLDKALAGLTTGSTLKLLSACDVGANSLAFTAGTYTLDLNGQVISGSNARGVITVVANVALTITNSNATVEGGIANTAGAAGYAVANNGGTLLLQAGKYTGSIVGAATITGGKFNPKPGDASIGDKQWSEADTYGYYTLEDKAGSGDDDPVIEDAIDDDVGKVEETTDEQGNKTATVTVTNASTSVTIQVPTGYQGTVKVVVPPTVDTITGLGAATLTVTAEGVDITSAFSKTTVEGVTTLALDPEGKVVIDGETINVEPQLVEDTTAEGTVAPFEVPADGAEANVAAIPGLTYELVTTDDLDVEFGSIVENGEVVPGAKKKATGKRVNLKDGRANRGDKGFYKVKVSK